jgi:hypothetical protein
MRIRDAKTGSVGCGSRTLILNNRSNVEDPHDIDTNADPDPDPMQTNMKTAHITGL